MKKIPRSTLILVLLHFSLKRRERMRAEREADIKKNSN